MKHRSTETLERQLGYHFSDQSLLEQALTHSSYAREMTGGLRDNEQLEFLGDSVLGMVTSQELFQRFPAYHEGELSKLRAHLVNAHHLMQVAEELELGAYLRLGRGEEKTGGRHKAAVLADALEAVVAALYLDAGLIRAREFVLQRILDPELERLADNVDEVLVADHKSKLQEVLRASGRPEPLYELSDERGPEHRKTFVMRVIVLGPDGKEQFRTEASGASKKRASQLAAQRALAHLQTAPEGIGVQQT